MNSVRDPLPSESPSDLPAPWHAMEGAEAAAFLGTDRGRGLEPAEAARRLAVHGPNRLPDAPGRSRVRILLAQFRNGLVILLAAAALIMGVLGEPADAAAIGAILVLNGLLGYFQESRAANALEALRRMTAPRARVRRGARDAVVGAGDLVPGDLVVLDAGDRVPADLRLLAASSLACDEAPLTGESAPVEKNAAPVPVETTLAERSGMAWSGTIVTTGAGEGLVVATGAATEFGRIAGMVGEEEPPETPLQLRLRSFGVGLGWACGGAVTLVFLLGILRGEPVYGMFLTAVSLAVAAVPEGLPAVVTVTLALGVARMARRGALVRRLPAVETLGGTTVICSDKTGTLTTGEMAVRAVAPADGAEEDGEDGGFGEGARELLRAAAAASAARATRDGRFAGDPTEAALLAAAARAGIDAAALEEEEPEVARRPFDAERRRMSVVRLRDGARRAYVKGAPESVLPRCRALRVPGGERSLAGEDRAALAARNEAMAGRGLRVLAVAVRELPADAGEGDAERDLVLLGFAGMADPPRPGAREAVASCREAGIRVVMVTGDQRATAEAVARDLGIGPGDSITGADIDAATDAELARRVPSVAVVARAAPEHKLRLVRAWRRRGAVVAVTGDGVNDAPALSGADIGVAMGRGGTDVARDAADMVLTDDDFGTIVSAVAEGRRIFENVRKTLLYLLSGNLGELLVMTVAVAAGWPLPLLPIQLLWVNLVTDGFPALALATDPAEPDVLRRPPRPPGGEIADRSFLAVVAARGPLVAAVTLAAFLLGWWGEGSEERARTYAFTTLVLSHVLIAFTFRSETRTLPELGAASNIHLLAVVVGSLLLQFGVHHSETLSGFLRTGPLEIGETIPLVLLALVPGTVIEGTKILRRLLRPKSLPA